MGAGNSSLAMHSSTAPIAGSQSISIHFVETLLLEGIAVSIGSVGNCL